MWSLKVSTNTNKPESKVNSRAEYLRAIHWHNQVFCISYNHYPLFYLSMAIKYFPNIYWYFLFQLFNKCKVLYYQWLFLVWFSRVSHGDGANGILGNIEHCVHPKSSDQGYRVGCWNLLDIFLCHCTTECYLPRSSYFEASTGKLRFYITHINAEILKTDILFTTGSQN